MPRISGWEWLIVALIIIVLFGAKKLPDLARSLGASAKEFRKGIEAGATDDEEDSTITEASKKEAE